MTPEEREAREARLPRWARAELEHLRRDLAHARALAVVGAEDSDTFLQVFHDAHRPLGKEAVVRFDVLGGHISARTRNGRLTLHGEGVHGFGQLAVLAESSNVVRVVIPPRGVVL